MSEQSGGLPPSDYGDRRHQRKVARLHAKIDRLYPKFGHSYDRTRKEIKRQKEQWDKIINFIPRILRIRKNEQDETPE